MKKINKIFRTTILTVVLVSCTLMTSCIDFLTIYPTDTVIHDKYWQTIDDVNGMLAASYLQLLSDDAVKRYIVWGELRSDNMIAKLDAESKALTPQLARAMMIKRVKYIALIVKSLMFFVYHSSAYFTLSEHIQ